MNLTHTHVASIVLQSIILIFSAGSSGATSLTPLPDAVWDGEVATSANGAFNPVFNNSPGTYSSNASSSFGTANATLNTFSLPNPSLSATITLSTPGTLSQAQAQAFGSLTYYMSVNGTGSGLVPVDVSSFGNVSMSGIPAGGLSSQANAVFQVGCGLTVCSPLLTQNISLTDPGYGLANPGGTGSFSVSQLLDLEVGTVYSVYMSVDVAALIGGAAANQTLTAFVDPVFIIEPGFAGASEFSLQFSDGIGDSPGATPLPSTWLMLLSGFVGLGFFAYRGTKNNAATLAAA